jgi:hypothetical protein
MVADTCVRMENSRPSRIRIKICILRKVVLINDLGTGCIEL